MKKTTAKTKENLADVYNGKRVLITGDTGFKGSWLALWLHELGASVTGIALAPSTKPSHFQLASLNNVIDHIHVDIRSLDKVKKVFAQVKPEIVFHLAAQALVRESYDDPKATFDTNVGGTVNILEAIRQCTGVRAVVVITSDKCYDNKEWVWGYRESDPLGGHDPYSASKGASEIVSAAYHRSYFDLKGIGPHLGFATARAGNVIGGGDWAKDRIIPDCVRALTANQPIIVRNPQATRPWQHVLDPLHGYLLLAARLLENPDRFSGAWNFGPQTSDQITVHALAERFIHAWGSGAIQTPPIKKAPHEAHLLHLNIDKAAFGLKWQPVLDSSSAINWTVDWYKIWHRSGKNQKNVSVQQIREFSNLAAMKGQYTS
ncbi:MAG: CDP-glucose 4,6-dehydratase [Deltaproteobacteria bacterium HGW-Deltaproteobacteria-6]|nr:MAG: CDP-glucose 4,6-dehydratase [Deltaproteobacteria bacterium HGW-Deltaproteobacteria-6]